MLAVWLCLVVGDCVDCVVVFGGVVRAVPGAVHLTKRGGGEAAEGRFRRGRQEKNNLLESREQRRAQDGDCAWGGLRGGRGLRSQEDNSWFDVVRQHVNDEMAFPRVEGSLAGNVRSLSAYPSATEAGFHLGCEIVCQRNKYTSEAHQSADRDRSHRWIPIQIPVFVPANTGGTRFLPSPRELPSGI